MTSDFYSSSIQAQVTPNPFHGSCMLSLGLRGTAPVTAAVFNAAGRRLRDLEIPNPAQRGCDLTWDGCDRDARPAPPGIYYLHLVSGSNSSCIKLVKE